MTPPTRTSSQWIGSWCQAMSSECTTVPSRSRARRSAKVDFPPPDRAVHQDECRVLCGEQRTHADGSLDVAEQLPRSCLGLLRVKVHPEGVALIWTAVRRTPWRGVAQEGTAQLEVALPTSPSPIGSRVLK
jgi:hypothetical protein